MRGPANDGFTFAYRVSGIEKRLRHPHMQGRKKCF